MNNFISNFSNIPNLITKFFDKINFVDLYEDHSKNIEWLEAMKKVPLYVKSISISSNNAEEFENLTDPNLHNTPIDSLQLNLRNSFEISAKTIENLKAIYPNSITLVYNPYYKDETAYKALIANFSKLLSNLDKTSLDMNFGDDYWIKLEFKDVIFKVVEPNEECSYIKAKSIRIGCTDEELCRIK